MKKKIHPSPQVRERNIFVRVQNKTYLYNNRRSFFPTLADDQKENYSEVYKSLFSDL